MRILTLSLMIALMPLAASAAEFDLDRGIGYKRGQDVESQMDVRGTRPAGVDPLQGVQTNTGTMGAAYGNLISITTAPNSHVALNAYQLNTGNQSVEVTLRNNMNTRQYRNVELAPEQDPGNNLYYQQ